MKRIWAVFLAFVLVLSLGLAGCRNMPKNPEGSTPNGESTDKDGGGNGGSGGSDEGGDQGTANETRPLTVATDMPNGSFNPFYDTADAAVGADKTITDITQLRLLATDKWGEIVAGEDEPCVAYDYSVVTTGAPEYQSAPDDYSHYYTDYYFALKDGITFSDGTPLTKNDVLFNLYMYLDPVYLGSTTLYSVDIQGLRAYRTQTTDISEQNRFENLVEERALERKQRIVDWTENDSTDDYNDLDVQQKADIAKVEELFREEIEADWNTAMATDLRDYDRYVDENGNKLITQQWEIFLYSYGLITLPAHRDGSRTWYGRDNFYDTNTATDKNTLTKFVFAYMLSGKENASKTYKDHLYNIINYYATANTFRQYLRGEAIGELVGDEMTVRTVSGITLERRSSLPDGSGDKALGKEYDILHIRINGVDPKAIREFAFPVAPLKYYSSTADKFNLTAGQEYFGAEFGDYAFMQSVHAIQVPMGAGAYRASASGGTAATDISEVKASDFFSGDTVYLESNENFLLGAPKIKKLCYKVYPASLLYEGVKEGDIDIASPQLTNEIIENLSGADRKKLDYTVTDALGYGYIGINASLVQDLNIRKAIMSAIDTSLCIDYYGAGDLATAIYRPMSMALKDYYPRAATAYYPFDRTGETSLQYAQTAGYTLNPDGLLVNAKGERLKYTFIVPGDTEDHPAYAALSYAAEILNGIGFDITVVHDSAPYYKIYMGQVAVWADEMRSSPDPDMFEVYHKDSNAMSVFWWGFPWIESADISENDTVQTQKDILNELAERIEEGRAEAHAAERKKAYSISTGDKLSEGGSVENLCALDLVMELAIQLPTYQKKALYLYPKGLFDDDTLDVFAGCTVFLSPLSRIWEMSYAE